MTELKKGVSVILVVWLCVISVLVLKVYIADDKKNPAISNEKLEVNESSSEENLIVESFGKIIYRGDSYVFERGINLYNPKDEESGLFMENESGELLIAEYNDTVVVTAGIPVSEGDILSISAEIDGERKRLGNVAYAFFNQEERYIEKSYSKYGSLHSQNTDYITIPNGVAYVKYNFDKSLYNKLMIEKGSTPLLSVYEPYQLQIPDSQIRQEIIDQKLLVRDEKIASNEIRLAELVLNQNATSVGYKKSTISIYDCAALSFNYFDFPNIDKEADWCISTKEHLSLGEGVLKIQVDDGYKVQIQEITENDEYFKAWEYTEAGTLMIDRNHKYRFLFLKSDCTDPIDNISDFMSHFCVVASYDSIVQSKWYGKKMVVLGDSITKGSYLTNEGLFIVPERWCDVIASKLGMKLETFGLDGSSISEGVDDIENFVDRVDTLPDDADMIVVFGGTNDYGNVQPTSSSDLGDITDTTENTFYGATKLLIEKLIEKYPDKTIVFQTPLHRGNDNEKNAKGHILKDYRDAIIECCEMYGIPVIDAYAVSGFSPSVESFAKTYMDKIILHPNVEGSILLGERLYSYYDNL